MKSINKMMITFAAVAALCITPLFIAVDTDAVIIEEGSTGVSVKIDRLTDTNADKLFTADNKNNLAMSALAVATDDSAGNMSSYWTLSEVKVTEIKNFRAAMGTKVTGNSLEGIRGGGIECKVSFKATSKVSYAPLFDYNDGTQKLNDFLDGRYAPTGSTLDVEGIYKSNTYYSESGNYFKTSDKNGCFEKTTTENTSYEAFSGSIQYTVNPGGAEKVRKYNVDTEKSTDIKSTVTFDYGNTDKNDVKGNTKVYLITSYDKYWAESRFEYTTGDTTDGKYSYSVDAKDSISPIGQYTVSEAKDRWFDEDMPLTEYHYYGNNYETCLFTSAGDAGLCNDSDMESFLKGLSGSTVSESYSDVKSVADSAYTSMNTGSGSGMNSLILYIIIGVLAVMIVLLVILMLRKKKEPKQEDQ